MVMFNSEKLRALPRRDQQILRSLYENKAISEYPDEWFADENNFKKKIFGWCALCGIRTLPDPVNILFLVDTFRQEWRGYSFEDFDLAFKMNQLGEFAEEVEAFNDFNIRFVAKIIRAYQKKRADVDKAYLHEKYVLLELPKPVIDHFEIDKDIAAAQYELFNKWVEDKSQYDGDYPGASVSYDVLVRFGIIQTDLTAYSRVANKALAHINTQARIAKTQRERIDQERILSHDGDRQAVVDRIAKTELLLEYYQFLESSEANFAHLLIRAVCTIHSVSPAIYLPAEAGPTPPKKLQ
jgi:hypothetical protein